MHAAMEIRPALLDADQKKDQESHLPLEGGKMQEEKNFSSPGKEGRGQHSPILKAPSFTVRARTCVCICVCEREEGIKSNQVKSNRCSESEGS